MKYQANSTALSQSTDCLIIGIYENNEFTKSFNEIDQITKGYLSQLAQSQDPACYPNIKRVKYSASSE